MPNHATISTTTQQESEHFLNRYCSAIDGLRAIAVIAVIICHFDERLMPSGYLGVDIFFVISGFVITASMLKRISGTPLSRIRGFYERRFKRLLPALSLVIAITAFLICIFVRQPLDYLKTGFFALFGLSNVSLYLQAVDYWGLAAALNPYTQTWSLGVEEQFYFVYPILLIFLTRRGVSKSSLRWLGIILSILAVISLFGFLAFYEKSPERAYFLSPFRFWQIALGCILYLVMRVKLALCRSLLARLPVNLILLILIGLLFVPRGVGVWTPVTITFLTALTISILISKNDGKPDGENLVLQNSAALYLGKISYSLYLWHWPLIVVARWTIGITIETAPILIIVMIFVSSASYHLVESPLRHIKWTRSPRSLATVVPLIAFAGLLVLLKTSIVKPTDLYVGRSETFSDVVEREFTPSAKKTSCDRIQLLGNSHSLMLMPMISLIGEKLNIDVSLTEKSDGEWPLIPSGDRRNLNKLDYLTSDLKDGDLLIISSRNFLLYERPYIMASGLEYHEPAKFAKHSKWGLDIWLDELDEVIATAARKGFRVVLVLPFPEFDEPIMNSELSQEEWFRPKKNRHTPVVSEEFLADRFNQRFYEELRNRAQAFDNFFTFDPVPLFRNENGNFKVTVNGVAAFNDTNHLSRDGAMLLLKPFYNFLLKNKLL